MIVFAQLMFLGCAGTFFTESFKANHKNENLMWSSFAVWIFLVIYILYWYSKIIEQTKKRKK
jgi:hypothetical protein